MSVETVMSRSLVTLDMDDDLEKAKKIIDAKTIHHILILHNKELMGIITDRDIFKHLSPSVGTRIETAKDTFLLHKKVHLIMSRNLVTAKASISLNEAALLFDDNHISCLPIVNDKNEPIGIITWRDIIKIVANNYRTKLKEKKE
ncbi:CBS domain-containing protein [Colwellia sp. UCD-KL20]|uniref:CBS domain-containing protein n=1 Tax=Colwellia sp. UCD-KL20 TaxID=1917165 RepID=UPI0009709711|nr:CBS domain-containing protein [Colwellia sp. UCD-KL20]